MTVCDPFSMAPSSMRIDRWGTAVAVVAVDMSVGGRVANNEKFSWRSSYGLLRTTNFERWGGEAVHTVVLNNGQYLTGNNFRLLVSHGPIFIDLAVYHL